MYTSYILPRPPPSTYVLGLGLGLGPGTGYLCRQDCRSIIRHFLIIPIHHHDSAEIQTTKREFKLKFTQMGGDSEKTQT